MGEKEEIQMFCPVDISEWRAWLKSNHKKKQAVWLVCYTKKSGMPVMTWSDLVDEALCFGWIDSKRQPIDENKHRQFFSRRKPNSTWSKINKEKVERLIAEKKMTRAGLEVIELAKKNGSWTILDETEALIIPKELEKAFKKYPGSKSYFEGLSRSVKKMLLQWIALAKKEETKLKRVEEIAVSAGEGKKPGTFR